MNFRVLCSGRPFSHLVIRKSNQIRFKLRLIQPHQADQMLDSQTTPTAFEESPHLRSVAVALICCKTREQITANDTALSCYCRWGCNCKATLSCTVVSAPDIDRVASCKDSLDKTVPRENKAALSDISILRPRKLKSLLISKCTLRQPESGTSIDVSVLGVSG